MEENLKQQWQEKQQNVSDRPTWKLAFTHSFSLSTTLSNDDEKTSEKQQEPKNDLV